MKDQTSALFVMLSQSLQKSLYLLEMMGHSEIVPIKHHFGLCTASLVFCLTFQMPFLKQALVSAYCMSKSSWLPDSF